MVEHWQADCVPSEALRVLLQRQNQVATMLCSSSPGAPACLVLHGIRDRKDYRLERRLWKLIFCQQGFLPESILVHLQDPIYPRQEKRVG
mmetsp:Transcript_59905/g.95143  ORF Transcript_59905/g.95143 Transcript_59905/m.95143 type:complete len:90 (+) Transcript_59905:235-504(+)